MNLAKTFKVLTLAAALAIPTFFAGNAFALNAPSICGNACTLSDYSNPKVPHGNYGMSCYGSCHSLATTPTPTPTPTPKPPVTTPTPPATGAVTPHATSKSCGACMKGTAPSSVAAHKNVNSTMTACAVCHSISSPTPTPPATGTVTPKPTSKSCGVCMKGTAPSNVSAHMNVNSTMTACTVCHSGSTGGSTGGPTGGYTGGHSDDHGGRNSKGGDHDNHVGHGGDRDGHGSHGGKREKRSSSHDD